jgi:hypothetical protein
MKLQLLTPKDYLLFKPFFENQGYRLCIYSLPSLISWSNDAYQPYAAVYQDALILAADFYRDTQKRHLILPVSPHSQFTPEMLYALAEELGYPSYWFVTEDYLQQYALDYLESLFTIREQEEYGDYIYRTSDLTELPGNKYSKKRNLVHQFVKEYVSAGRVSVEPITSKSAAECIHFLDEWCKERQCDKNEYDELACERQAALNTIRHIEMFAVKGILLRIDGNVSAFGIGAHLTDDIGVLHFEKAFARYKGLYQYFDNQCARLLFEGYSFINKESDMGIPGLAKAKQSYHPAIRVKSYELVLRK